MSGLEKISLIFCRPKTTTCQNRVVLRCRAAQRKNFVQPIMRSLALPPAQNILVVLPAVQPDHFYVLYDDPARDRTRDCIRATQYCGRTIEHTT